MKSPEQIRIDTRADAIASLTRDIKTLNDTFVMLQQRGMKPRMRSDISDTLRDWSQQLSEMRAINEDAKGRLV